MPGSREAALTASMSLNFFATFAAIACSSSALAASSAGLVALVGHFVFNFGGLFRFQNTRLSPRLESGCFYRLEFNFYFFLDLIRQNRTPALSFFDFLSNFLTIWNSVGLREGWSPDFPFADCSRLTALFASLRSGVQRPEASAGANTPKRTRMKMPDHQKRHFLGKHLRIVELRRSHPIA